MAHPWSRRPKESWPAYAAFLTYRDMGRQRSTAKVARVLGKSKTLMDRWSRRDSWVFRADQWDAHLDQLAEERIREHVARLAEEHAGLAREARTAVAKALELLIKELNAQDAIAPDFRKVIYGAAVAVKLERLIMGEPTERTDVSGDHVLVVGGRKEDYVAVLRRMRGEV